MKENVKIGAPLPEEVAGLLKAVTLEMSDLFLAVTDEGLIRYASANCTRLLGFDQHELLGSRASAYVHRDELSLASERLKDVIENGTPFTFPARLRNKAGEFAWWEVHGSPYTVGGARRIFIVARDIDEKLKALLALAESERLIRRLYEIASDPQSGLEEKLKATLALGSEHFGLCRAVVCRQEKTEHTVIARSGCTRDEAGVPPMLADVFAYAAAAGGPTATQPEAGLPSFCNVIRVDGRPWGTLAFYDVAPRVVHFSEAERDILNLMTLLVAAEIERDENEVELRRLALHDPLTDLPNRRLLDDRIGAALEMCKRFKTTCSILFVDLDRFKSINDELGHATGDAALRDVSQRIAAQLRNVDTLARVGGDEFVALLPQTDAAGAKVVADRIMDAIDRPLRIAHRPSITASIGIAVFSGTSDSAASLVERADAAMYKVKSRGRGGISQSA